MAEAMIINMVEQPSMNVVAHTILEHLEMTMVEAVATNMVERPSMKMVIHTILEVFKIKNVNN